MQPTALAVGGGESEGQAPKGRKSGSHAYCPPPRVHDAVPYFPDQAAAANTLSLFRAAAFLSRTRNIGCSTK